MFELSSLYCKIKITKFQLEKFLKNPLEKPQLNHNWLEWWDSQKMHSKSVLTEELLRSYNYDINKEVVDKWMKHPKALTFSDYNEITEEWHWGILFFSQNFIEMLPMLAFIISMESYVTESTENMAIVFPFFFRRK